MCVECGTKWVIYDDRADERDLTECGRCGGSLVRFVAPSAGGGYGSLPGEDEGGIGENG